MQDGNMKSISGVSLTLLFPLFPSNNQACNAPLLSREILAAR